MIDSLLKSLEKLLIMDISQSLLLYKVSFRFSYCVLMRHLFLVVYYNLNLHIDFTCQLFALKVPCNAIDSMVYTTCLLYTSRCV